MVIRYLTELYHEYQTAIVIMIGLLIVFFSNNTISKKKRNYLFKIIAIDFLLMIVESITHSLLTPDVEMITFRITLDMLGYIIRPTLIVYFYLLVCERQNPKFNLLLILPLVIDGAVCVSAYFTDLPWGYKTVDGVTSFYRGPLGFVPFAVSACYLIIAIIDSIRFFMRGREKTSFAVLYSALVVILGSVIETIYPEKRLLVNFTMLSTLIYFLMLYFKTIMEQEEEIIHRTRIEMMYSQIGPHFIFNTLSAIYGLVDKDPRKAKEAITRFSDYLRGNIDSIGKPGWVSFEEELKHIDSYVWIEKMRFGDDLLVDYDIDTMKFDVPPLSIQPLVENAIKHGIHKKAGRGRVVISTYETNETYIVEVKDNGVGFDTTEFERESEFEIKNISDRGLGLKRKMMREKKKEEPKNKFDKKNHVGLANTRSRLLASGRGKLDIVSTIGEGTTAIVTIYKEPGTERLR